MNRTDKNNPDYCDHDYDYFYEIKDSDGRAIIVSNCKYCDAEQEEYVTAIDWSP